jgi:hypothetical protein
MRVPFFCGIMIESCKYTAGKRKIQVFNIDAGKKVMTRKHCFFSNSAVPQIGGWRNPAAFLFLLIVFLLCKVIL